MKQEELRNQAILVMKPDAFERSVEGKPVPEVITSQLEELGLSIIEQADVLLSEQDLRKIYPILNVHDPVYGDGWKVELIKHLTGRPIRALYIVGDNAQVKATNVKNDMRRLFDEGTQHSKVVANIAHVADESDFDDTYLVLFETK